MLGLPFSLRGHPKADGEEQVGSQSCVPPEAKDDKALNLALDLMRGVQENPAFPRKRRPRIYRTERPVSRRRRSVDLAAIFWLSQY